jgi:glycerate dehydrogenase
MLLDETLRSHRPISHSPLMPATRNMLAMPEFRKMKRRPLIINTARGGLVDERDLVKALDEGLVSGIGFDVLTEEPPDPAHPLLAIADRPNVIITPHVAWASQEAMEECWRQTVKHIEDFHRGQPTNLVT